MIKKSKTPDYSKTVPDWYRIIEKIRCSHNKIHLTNEDFDKKISDLIEELTNSYSKSGLYQPISLLEAAEELEKVKNNIKSQMQFTKHR